MTDKFDDGGKNGNIQNGSPLLVPLGDLTLETSNFLNSQLPSPFGTMVLWRLEVGR